MTTQQERLIDGVLEAALTRFDGAILVGFAEVVAAGSQTIVFAQVGVAPRQFFLFGQVVEGGREAVGPMFLGDASQRPQGVLHALGQCREAFAAAYDFGVTPAGIGERKLVQPMREGFSGDRDAQTVTDGEIR